MQDYKSLRVVVMICATLVNTQTHIDSFWPVILLAWPAELKMMIFMGQTHFKQSLKTFMFV